MKFFWPTNFTQGQPGNPAKFFRPTNLQQGQPGNPAKTQYTSILTLKIL